MKLNSLVLTVFTTLAFATTLAAQQPSKVQVVRVAPYDKAVPGQIMQLMVAGLEDTGPMMPATDFELTVSQDGISQPAKIRTVTKMLTASAPHGDGQPTNAPTTGMRSFQSVNFVVPPGLHPGGAELLLAYRGEPANAVTLTVVEKPLRPMVGNLSVVTIGPPSAPLLPPKAQGRDLGWRLERGLTARLFVNPTTDPDDPNSAVLVHFQQGDQSFDTKARVVNQAARVENRNRRVGFFPARDILEVDVPAGLATGPVEVSIRLRANGQEGDAATLMATIVDATRSAEAPAANAPRLLLVTPRRVSAGLGLLLSVDYQRTLDPDPTQTVAVIEQGNARYLVTPERSSANFERSQGPDVPVLFFVRTTREITGPARIRIFNQLRGEQTGMSEPVPIEIVAEMLAPELIAVRESSESDLAPLRQMYELQSRAGRPFPAFDPRSKYVTIQVKGIDYNPKYVLITFAQGERVTLAPGAFSSFTGEQIIVRLPQEIKPGSVKLTIRNRDGDRLSTPASKTFEVCCTH
ncbi:MAG: hypothetical protein QOJ88_521 [Pyrinomonadaceae bacterium]|nr:hypothetical protein [Pyrinomonadaceae bacterium]